MTKKIMLFFSFLCTLGLLSAQNSTLSKKSYSIAYLPNWTISKSCTETNCSLLAPGDGLSDTFSENINIVIEKAQDPNMTAQKYADFSKGYLPSKISKFKLLESKKVTQNGTSGWYMVFKGSQKGIALKWKQYYFIKKGKIFIMTFTAQEDKYDTYIQNISESLGSFKVL